MQGHSASLNLVVIVEVLGHFLNPVSSFFI